MIRIAVSHLCSDCSRQTWRDLHPADGSTTRWFVVPLLRAILLLRTQILCRSISTSSSFNKPGIFFGRGLPYLIPLPQR